MGDVPRVLSLLLAVGLLGSIGCSAQQRIGGHRVPRLWVQQHGGVVEGPELARAQRVASVFAEAEPAIDVRVLDSNLMGAFSWAPGDVYLTRRLVGALDDDELAAAIAHELAHLVQDGHLDMGPRTLVTPVVAEPEARADRLGRRLLEQHGVAPEVMVEMLASVSAGVQRQPATVAALARRMKALRSPPAP